MNNGHDADITEGMGVEREVLADFGVVMLVGGLCSKFEVQEGESAEYARWSLAQEIKAKVGEIVERFNNDWEGMDLKIKDLQIDRTPHKKELRPARIFIV